MARTIDQKVVEMRFDNRQFEQETKKTMSTLDKLKSKLSFKGATDGMDKLGKSAKNVSMDGLVNGVETVSAKFSAMDIIATTALVNITNSAVNAGKRIVASISIDQVTAGWSKMEQQMGSMQTLMNSTGKELDVIEGYLDDLMWYSDETSYGFTDMTTALANMTATGGDIEKLVPMIMGIANATAYAGKGAAEFSRVIYNLNQSYGGGYLNLMDWKSVQLAGANSKQLTESLIKWGVEIGTLKEGQVTIGNFNDSLKDRWATTEVMEKAFGEFADFTLKVKEAVDAGEYVTASKAISALAKDYTGISATAFKAAQEAKSFTEAVDATKDAVSSGWMRVFKVIFGNYDEQRVLWTDLANSLWDIFASPIDSLEGYLRQALQFDPVKNMWDKINGALTGNPVADAIKDIDGAVKKSSKSLEEYQAIVTKVWRGDFNNRGDNPDRFDLLGQAGWDPKVVQELVNETDRRAGYGKGWTVIDSLTIDDVAAAEKKYGITVEETTEAMQEQQQVQKETAKLTDEYLSEVIGLTEDQIELYRNLEKASRKYGVSVEDIIKKMETMNGQQHLEGSWREIGTIIKETIGAIGIAMGEVFRLNPINLYMSLDRLHEKLTKVRELLIGTYVEDEDSGEMVLQRSKHYQNLVDTLKGFFSIIKLITTVVGSGFRIAFTIVSTILKVFGLTILDVTAAIGNVVTALVDWIEDNNFIIKGIEWLVKTIIGGINWIWDWADAHWGVASAVRTFLDVLKKGKSGIKNWVEGLMAAENVGQYLLETFGKIPGKLKELWNAFQQTKIGQVVMGWWDKLKNSDVGKAISRWINDIKGTDFIKKITNYFNSFDGGSVGMNIVLGIWEGIKTYGGKAIEGIKNLGVWLLTAIKEVLGIHSPSTEFFTVGQNIVQGLFGGIGSLIGMVYNLVSTIGSKMIDIVKDLDIGSVFVALVSAGAIFGIVQFAKAIGKLADILDSFDRLVDQARQTMKAFEGVLKAFKIKLITAAIKDVAVSIAILAGSIWVLSKIDTGDLWKAIGAIAAMVVLIGALVVVAGKFGKAEALQFGKLALTILAIGVAMMMMASALKKIAKIKDLSWQAIVAFGLMIGALLGVAYVASRGQSQLMKLSGILIGMGVALYLMSMVVKKLGKMDSAKLKQGVIALGTFGLLIVALMAATKLLPGGKNLSKFGPMMLQVGLAFYLMSMTVNKLGKMDPAKLKQGMLALTGFEALIIGLMAATRLLTGSKNVGAIGATLAAVGGAILLMAVSVRLMGNMDAGALAKGTIVVSAFMGMIVGLIYAIKKIGGKDIDNINRTLLGVAGMIAVMTLSVALLGMMDVKHLAKGLIVVGFMSLFVMGIIKATSNARNIGKTLWPIVAAIGVLALAIGLLSIIDPKRLAAPTIALGLLMGMFALIVKLSKDVGKSKDLIASLIVMTVIVGALAFIISKLAKLDPGSAVTSAAAIGILLIAMTSSLSILSKMKINPKDLAIGVLGLLAVVIALVPLIAAIKMLNGMDSAGSTILALSVLIGMLTVMLIGIAATGAIYAATGGLGLLGIVGLYAILPAMVAVIGMLALMNAIPNAEQNVILLTSLLGVMVGMLLVIGTVGILAIAGVAALYALLAIMPPLLLFCTGLGALVTYLPMLEEFMNKGLGILITLAGGLGEMLGAFVSGVLTQLSAGLPEIGTNLSQFMINLMPFIVGMKLVNGQTLKGVGILTAAILALTIADFINGVLSLLPIGGNLAGLGTQLSQFAANALPFMMIMASIPPAAMQGVSALAGAVLTLTQANLLDGLARFIGMGGSSLEEFGAKLPPLGTSLAQFVANLGTFGDDQIKTTECAANAIVAIADAAQKLPKEGGWAQAIFGETNLAKFAEQMPVVAGGVVGFVDKLGNFSDPQIKTAEAACKVITAIADAAKSLPKEGGFWQKLFGSEGDGLTKFAGNMPKVGEGVKGFINELDSVKDKVGVADAGAKIIESIAKLSNLDLDAAGKKLPGFGDKMKEFGVKLKDFISNFKSVSEDDVKTVNGNMQIVVEAVKNLISTIKGTANDNAEMVITTMEDIGKKTAKALGSDSVMKELKDQGKNFVTGFSTAIKNNSSLAEGAAREMTKKAMEAIKNTQNSNSPAKETIKLGGDFGDGYVMTIGSYASKAYAVSANVGEEAKKGLSSSVLKMSNLIDADMDVNPTIRPVLDLSDVTNGANQINSMFQNPSLQMSSNLSSISSGMKNRNQNGNEVVSAIDKLGSNLGKGGDTININGVSYADTDTDISNAIGVLLRAANVERRT